MNSSVIGTFVLFLILVQVSIQQFDDDEFEPTKLKGVHIEEIDKAKLQNDENTSTTDEAVEEADPETDEAVPEQSDEGKPDEALPEQNEDGKLGLDDEQIQREEADADIFDIFNQQHQYYPKEFKDLGRRHQEHDFDIEDDTSGFGALRPDIADQRDGNHLIPVRAPPEFVYSVAQKSDVINKYNLRHHPENYNIPKEHLRTGQYWNSFWVEKVDPEQQRQKALRSLKITKPRPEKAPGLESVKARIEPGSELFKVVSGLTDQNSSPKLLYVINEGNK